MTDGVVEATVTAVAGESTLARIAAAIQDAQSQRAPTQRFVDQFARYYTPAVVAVAFLVAVLGPVLLGGTWGEWLYEAWCCWSSRVLVPWSSQRLSLL